MRGDSRNAGAFLAIAAPSTGNAGPARGSVDPVTGSAAPDWGNAGPSTGTVANSTASVARERGGVVGSVIAPQSIDMIRLASLSANRQVIDDLAWPYDFDLDRAGTDTAWITLRPSVNFHVLAGDGTGGVFLAYGEGSPDDLPVLHATSEGQAGKIANNLGDVLALHIQLPYWRDVLKFSGNGDLDQMRRAATALAVDYDEDMPELPDAKARLLGALDVPVLDDPIAYLHHCVREIDCTLVASDGYVWGSLFNSFTIDRRRSW